MKSRCFVAILLAALFAFGCKGKPSLVGAWAGTLSTQGATVDMELTFGEDGNLLMKQTVMGQSSSIKGPYKAGEKSFMFSPTSIEAGVFTKEQQDKANEQLTKAKKSANFTLEWKDPDTISIEQVDAAAPLKVPIVLKRKKS